MDTVHHRHSVHLTLGPLAPRWKSALTDWLEGPGLLLWGFMGWVLGTGEEQVTTSKKYSPGSKQRRQLRIVWVIAVPHRMRSLEISWTDFRSQYSVSLQKNRRAFFTMPLFTVGLCRFDLLHVVKSNEWYLEFDWSWARRTEASEPGNKEMIRMLCLDGAEAQMVSN